MKKFCIIVLATVLCAFVVENTEAQTTRRGQAAQIKRAPRTVVGAGSHSNFSYDSSRSAPDPSIVEAEMQEFREWTLRFEVAKDQIAEAEAKIDQNKKDIAEVTAEIDKYKAAITAVDEAQAKSKKACQYIACAGGKKDCSGDNDNLKQIQNAMKGATIIGWTSAAGLGTAAVMDLASRGENSKVKSTGVGHVIAGSAAAVGAGVNMHLGIKTKQRLEEVRKFAKACVATFKEEEDFLNATAADTNDGGDAYDW